MSFYLLFLFFFTRMDFQANALNHSLTVYWLKSYTLVYICIFVECYSLNFMKEQPFCGKYSEDKRIPIPRKF